MCRMFGFRSVLQSHVHHSLTSADNALAVQSDAHPDGWGVAYYVSGSPHLIRSAGQARTDTIFRRVSGVVTSQTVLAHIRQATQGEIHPLNCHPFQFGRWVMAHNGDVPNFGEHRPTIIERIAPKLRPFLLGDTDSEVLFLLVLSHLSRTVDLDRKGTPIQAVVDAIRRAVDDVREIADPGAERASLLTVLLTDGDLMVAHQGGKDLHFSTHKTRCSERGTCAFFAAECEAPSRSGYVNHLLISSEPLSGENVWTPMQHGEVVAIDTFMRFSRHGVGV